MDALKINKDGSGEITINKYGLPAAECLIPGLDLSLTEREEQLEKAKEGAWLRGLFVDNIRRVRNTVFDKKGQKTSIKMCIRMCKNREEAEFVLGKVKKIVQNKKE